MTKESKIGLAKDQMDAVISAQEAEQTPTQQRQASSFQEVMQSLQAQEMHVRIRLMGEELVTKQVANIVSISNAIKIVENPTVKQTLETLLNGYCVEQKEA